MNKHLIIFYASPSKTVWGQHLKDYLEGRKKVSQATAGGISPGGGAKIKSATALEKIHHPAIQMFVSFNKEINHKNARVNCRLCIGNPSENSIYETRAYNLMKLEGFGSDDLENSEPMPLPRIFTRARQVIARKICETREIKTSFNAALAEKEVQISQLMFPYSKLIRSNQGEFTSIWDKYASNASQILKELLPTSVLKDLVYYGFYISHQKYRVANNIENFVKSFVIGYIRFILQAIDRLDIYGPISLSTGSIFEYLKEKGLIDRANSIFTCNSSPLLFARATGPISRALAKRINPLGAFAVKRLFNWKIFSDTLVKNLILIDSVIIQLVMKYQLLNTALLSKAISQIPPNSEQFSDADYRIIQAYKCLECFPVTAQEAITMKADKSADPRRLFSLMHKTRVMTDPISGKIVKEERNFDFIFTLNFTNRLYYLDIEHIYNYQKTYCFTPVFSDPIYMSFYLLLEGGIDGFFGTAFKGDLITPLATPNFREKFKTDILDKFKKIYYKIESAVAYLDSHLLKKGFHDISL